jgi:hypothetical protein
MGPLAKPIAYVAVTGGVLIGLAGGVTWLVQPDPGHKAEARAAVIPPRIADSIERKKQPVRPVESETPKPVMQEANVALTPAPQPKFRMRDVNAPPPRARQRRQARNARAGSETPPAPAAPAVTTARTDFPY